MDKTRKNLLVTEKTTVLDSQSGEVIEETESIKTQMLEKEPNYIKLYTDDVGRLFDLPGSTSDVLAAIASHMAYKTNIIVLYGPIKKVLMAELNMNANTFNKAVDTLYKAGMLIRISRACYMVDPQLYGSGSWNDVKKVRLSIEYNSDGTKSVKTTLVKQMEDQKTVAIEEFDKQIKARAKHRLEAPKNQLSMSFDEE